MHFHSFYIVDLFGFCNVSGKRTHFCVWSVITFGLLIVLLTTKTNFKKMNVLCEFSFFIILILLMNVIIEAHLVNLLYIIIVGMIV